MADEALETVETLFTRNIPVIDLDAAPPTAPIGQLRLGDRLLPIKSLFDLQMNVVHAMMLEEAKVLREGMWLDQVALARRQIQCVIPDITEEDLDTFTSRQLIQLSAQVVGPLTSLAVTKE